MDIKGQIVVYTIPGCPHCKAAKACLEENNLPFHVINLEGNADAKKELFSATSSLSNLF